MRALLPAALLLVTSAMPAFAQPQRKPEPRYFAIECGDFSEAASSYFRKHGIAFLKSYSFEGFRVLTGGREPWTDAQGNRINDSTVYGTYADRESGEKLLAGMWHLRLSHYTLQGELKPSPDERKCNVDFQLRFKTSGAQVIGILPVDSSWSYASNGRLELEYLDGISAELNQRTPAGKPRELH
jgi:hypothetical protein